MTGKSKGRQPLTVPKLARNMQAYQPRHRQVQDDDNESDEEEVMTTTAKLPSPPSKQNKLTPVNLTPPSTRGTLLDATVSTKYNTQTTTPPLVETPHETPAITPTGNDANSQDRRDYRLVMAPQSADVVLRSVINTVLFRRIKFIDVHEHKHFSLELNTVCGLLLSACHVPEDTAEEWWQGVQGKLCRLLTDHRNNCIKSIHKCFKSKY